MPTHSLTRTPTDSLPQSDGEVQSLITATITAQLKREKLRADRDQSIIKASEPFAGQIDDLTAAIERDVKTLERWGLANRDRFGTAKSLVMGGHRFGWRLGSWGTGTAKKHTWKTVLIALKDIIQSAHRANASEATQQRATLAANFIRTEEKPAKELMLAWREDPTAHALLKECGVTFEQEQTFFLSPDREGQDAPTLTTAL